MLRLVFCLFLLGCANHPYKEIKQEHQAGNISTNAVLNLARTSYLKGCQENSKLSFNQCIKKARQHSKNIKTILDQ
jgi:hypothetical protein